MKPLAAGSEIDAWCTKCRMDLGHRIVALVKARPKRVICLTCNSEHNYRAPESEKGKTKAAPRAKGSTTQRLTAKAKAENERVHDWESRIAGQGLDAFVRYSMDRTFSVDQLVSHKKFGDGFVLEVLEGGKVCIMFRDGPKTLAHGHS